MKSILKLSMLIVLLFSTSMLKAQENKGIHWISFEEAIALNEESPKLVFIDVYTDWCGWCKKMDASTFSNPEIVKYMNEKYYCVKLDAESKEPMQFMGQEFINPNPDGRKSTHQLAALLLNNKLSYPSYVFMNEDNKVLTVVKGYKDVNGFDPILHWFGEQVYLNTPFQEYIQVYNANK